MELQTAIEILEYHQEWRLGKRDEMIYEPKQITEAFDVVLNEVKKNRLGDITERSEQLVTFLKWVGDGYDFENNAEKIVKEYIDGGN